MITSLPLETRSAIAPEFLIGQDWAAYTAEQHEVWGLLYDLRMSQLRTTASHVFLEGMERIGLQRHQLPDLAEVNRRLAPRTGWRAMPVSGFIPGGQFFVALSERNFPTTTTIRGRESLGYISAPDIFHDVFGHVPLHAHSVFADFLQEFGAAAAQARTPEEMEMMARLFWFSVEFGLIREQGEIKIYGSGLISSATDAANALSDRCERRPFTLDGVANQSVTVTEIQQVLFVIDSFDQLFAAAAEARRRIGAD